MGVQITNAESVALYESTTGIAFGPIFHSETDADDFLDWLVDEYAKNRKVMFGNEEILILSDAALYRNDELVFLKDMWEKDRENC